MMESHDNVVPLRRVFQCASCGSANGTSIIEPIEFEYDRGNATIQLRADVPVEHCGDCGENLLAETADGIKHESVCRHLGVLTPSEITSLRRSLDISRDRLAEMTGIGLASIARWEQGKLIQNTAYDRLLRLLRLPEVRRKLSENISTAAGPNAQPTFRCLVRNRSVEAKAANFELS